MDTPFVPSGSVGIALDTNVLWHLAEKTAPSWFATFLEMKEGGFLFSLADHAFAEIFNQFETGRLTPDQYKTAMERLEKLINPDWPILPGKRKLATSCGTPSASLAAAAMCFDLDHDQAYSKAVWNHLRQAQSVDDLAKPFEYIAASGNKYRCEYTSATAAKELQAEREKWKKSFSEVELVDGLDQDVVCTPSTTTRLSAAIEYLLACKERHKNGDYHPESKNSNNDGIDYNMTWVFMKKMLLCTAERKFTDKIRDLDSPQKAWIYRPEELAEAWKNCTIVRPEWPK